MGGHGPIYSTIISSMFKTVQCLSSFSEHPILSPFVSLPEHPFLLPFACHERLPPPLSVNDYRPLFPRAAVVLQAHAGLMLPLRA